jgi:hypothetical protein
MQRKRGIFLAVLLMLSIGNFSRLSGTENIRPIEFLSIFTIGLFSGLLLFEIIARIKAKQKA